MFRRIFPSRGNNTANNGSFRDEAEDPSNNEGIVPPSPLVSTTDGTTVVRLYLEILACHDLGPDFTDDGERIQDHAYQPYVKVKLGGKDDKTSLDLHKTKPCVQLVNQRDPIFCGACHPAFCIDGLTVEELSQGILFKVKDDATHHTHDKVLGWALVKPESLWGMDDSASDHYQDIVDHALEFPLVHPTQLVTRLAGSIHILVRAATQYELDMCRAKGWGYFRPYTVAAHVPVGGGNTNTNNESTTEIDDDLLDIPSQPEEEDPPQLRQEHLVDVTMIQESPAHII